mmetsp:Transcript_118575/g.377982  ORF Transcript_118575/g.377982 Transcript_118575/m.377982 type:complete len:299 (-) Transcript_118575:193-1089(-)
MAVPERFRGAREAAVRQRRSMGAIAAACGLVALVPGAMLRSTAFASAFSAGASQSSIGQHLSARQLRTPMRAEAFDPFGWKNSLKDTFGGLLGGFSDEGAPELCRQAPSKIEEQMIFEIFQKFDSDGDGILNLEEFNSLQVSTEGEDAVYNADQLKSLLVAVNPDIGKPELGMPFSDYRRLYAEGRLRQAYSTDARRDHAKIFGEEGFAKAAAVVEALAKAAAVAQGLSEGAEVTIEGLGGAVELNGQSGKIVVPVEAEANLVAEGRLIVQLAGTSERIALKPANLRTTNSKALAELE